MTSVRRPAEQQLVILIAGIGQDLEHPAKHSGLRAAALQPLVKKL